MQYQYVVNKMDINWVHLFFCCKICFCTYDMLEHQNQGCWNKFLQNVSCFETNSLTPVKLKTHSYKMSGIHVYIIFCIHFQKYFLVRTLRTHISKVTKNESSFNYCILLFACIQFWYFHFIIICCVCI